MKILIIQTAFAGDVVLATPLIEKLLLSDKNNIIDFLIRKGNESLLQHHPHINDLILFDKKKNKYSNLLKIIFLVRSKSYDCVINVQRFFSTGLITVFSGAKMKIGFSKNPLSAFYSNSLKHQISGFDRPVHEVERNLSLLTNLADTSFIRPEIFPSSEDFQKVETREKYVCIAPASTWFTKQLPEDKWCELIKKIPAEYTIILLGSKDDQLLCENIRKKAGRDRVKILAGKLSFTESAALIKNAKMTFTNDSAPLHLASAMNAPVTAIYCSTVPEFGFGPLSDISNIIEVEDKLYCRPCGIHGKKKCPEKHFKCSEINIERIITKSFPGY